MEFGWAVQEQSPIRPVRTEQGSKLARDERPAQHGVTESTECVTLAKFYAV